MGWFIILALIGLGIWILTQKEQKEKRKYVEGESSFKMKSSPSNSNQSKNTSQPLHILYPEPKQIGEIEIRSSLNNINRRRFKRSIQEYPVSLRPFRFEEKMISVEPMKADNWNADSDLGFVDSKDYVLIIPYLRPHTAKTKPKIVGYSATYNQESNTLIVKGWAK